MREEREFNNFFFFFSYSTIVVACILNISSAKNNIASALIIVSISRIGSCKAILSSFQCLCCQVRIKHLKPAVSDLDKKGSNEWQRILPLISLEIPCPS